MKKPLGTLITALSLSVISACGGASAAGVYELDKAALKESAVAAMPEGLKQTREVAEMMTKQFDSMNISIDLKADGTAKMMAKMPTGSQDDADGTWKLEGSKLTMTTKDKNGVQETKVADYQSGSFSFEEQQGPMKLKMTFRRK